MRTRRLTKAIQITALLALVLLVTVGADKSNGPTRARSWALIHASTPKSVQAVTTLENDGFTVGYSEERLNPLWVRYEVYDVDFSAAVGRKSWRIDTRTQARVSTNDYKWTGYDRGHMAPNKAIARCYGDDAQQQTFLMSNVCPQLHPLNDSPWGDLEDSVRDYANAHEAIWVVTGPIFDDMNGNQYLQKDADHADQAQKPVEIPERFYKIIVDEVGESLRMLAFIIPQDATYGSPLASLLVSVDEVENETGLDFFWRLEDTLEESLESTLPSNTW